MSSVSVLFSLFNVSFLFFVDHEKRCENVPFNILNLVTTKAMGKGQVSPLMAKWVVEREREKS